MVGDDVPRPFEPERGELRQHLPLVGNAGAENVVERGDPIGRDDEQLVAEVVDVAHLALTIGRTAGDGSLKNGSGERQGDLVPRS